MEKRVHLMGPYKGAWGYHASRDIRPDGIAPDDGVLLAVLERLTGAVYTPDLDIKETYARKDTHEATAALDAIVEHATLEEYPEPGKFIELAVIETESTDSICLAWYNSIAKNYLGGAIVDIDQMVTGNSVPPGPISRLVYLTPMGLTRVAILCNQRVPGSEWCAPIAQLVATSATTIKGMREMSLVAAPVSLETLAEFPLPYLDRHWMRDAAYAIRNGLQDTMRSLLAPPNASSDGTVSLWDLERAARATDTYEEDAVMSDAPLDHIARGIMLFEDAYARERGFNICLEAVHGRITVYLCIMDASIQRLLSLLDGPAVARRPKMSPTACIGTAYQLALWLRCLWLFIHSRLAAVHGRDQSSNLLVRIKADIQATNDRDDAAAILMGVTDDILDALYIRDTRTNIIGAHSAMEIQWKF